MHNTPYGAGYEWCEVVVAVRGMPFHRISAVLAGAFGLSNLQFITIMSSS